MKKTTLGELGNRLPSGALTHDGAWVGDVPFRFRRFNLRFEKEAVAPLLAERPALSIGAFVTALLAEALTQLGPDAEFGAKPLEVRRQAVGRLAIGDALYLYTAFRRHALGKSLALRVTCSCGKCAPFTFDGDLDTVEVVACEKAEERVFTFDLRDSEIVTPAGQRGKRLVIGPAPWSTLEPLGTPKAFALLKYESLRTGIREVEGINTHGAPLVVTEEMLDDLAKEDYEPLLKLVDERMPGPLLSVSGKSPHCGRPFQEAIDWRYGDFFAGASMSAMKT
jgi:hypothetical protein